MKKRIRNKIIKSAMATTIAEAAETLQTSIYGVDYPEREECYDAALDYDMQRFRRYMMSPEEFSSGNYTTAIPSNFLMDLLLIGFKPNRARTVYINWNQFRCWGAYLNLKDTTMVRENYTSLFKMYNLT